MSLVEDLRQIEQRVTRRLNELEPLVAEYRDLREIAERIGAQVAHAVRAPAAQAKKPTQAPSKRPAPTRGGVSAASGMPGAVARPAAAAKASTAPERRTTAKPAAAGGRRRAAAKPVAAGKRAAGVKPTSNGRAGRKRDGDVVRIVTQQPGITVAQVGKQLGVDPTGLYRVVRRLEAEGQISKEGTGLKPAVAAK